MKNKIWYYNATHTYANGDLDHDGLSNPFEYHHRLNMQDSDTDPDGTDNGAEYH